MRADSSSVTILPANASLELNITVTDENKSPINLCAVVALADNGTTIKATTNNNGLASLPIPVRRNYSILIAHPEFPGTCIENVDPKNSMNVTLKRADNIGSLIIDSTGYIPGFSGRLNPILDNLQRTYLYATNIAINDGLPQPVYFQINEPLVLEDANGVIKTIFIRLIAGTTTFLQYIPN